MGNTQSSSRRQPDSPTSHETETTLPSAISQVPSQRDSLRLSRRQNDGSRRSIASSRYSGIYDSIMRRTHDTRSFDSRINTLETAEDEVEPGSQPRIRRVSTSLNNPTPADNMEHSFSTMSRVGSRLLPDSVIRGLLSSGEETVEEGRTLRQGTIRRQRPSTSERDAPSAGNDRFSLSGAFRRRTTARNIVQPQIRGPFPPNHFDQINEPIYEPRHLELGAAHTGNSQEALNLRPLPRRRTTLSRMRNSLHFPLTSFLSNGQDRRRSYLPRSPTPHPGQSSEHNQSERNLSNSRDPDDIAHELDAVEPEARNISSTSRLTSGMTSIRRFQHGLRSRSTRLINGNEHPPLSQVLQLAAAAIATQLSGHGNGNDGARTLGGEAFDGSIQNFVQTLQDAASAQAGESLDMNASEGDLPPVNFMRVFQFPNDENGAPTSTPHSRDSERLNAEIGTSAEHDRSVTLVLVGVRSMPNVQDGSAGEGGTLGPSLDTLLSLPFMPPANILRNGSSGALFRRSDTRSRSNRHHSMTNFPAQYESQRHSRMRATARSGSLDPPLLYSSPGIPTPVSETPPGPHPPPSTPADVRSGHATPVRRPSSASAAQASLLPHLEEDNRDADQYQTEADTGIPSPRQRRRSDTEFARRPELGSGATRRNGVVEPDRPPIGAGRSWLIYVVGTNVSPDHPAFTMPSLFTDNPSYEDMQMLSTLLGPVKPPVATRDDVNSAGGTFRLLSQDNILVAQPIDNSTHDSFAMANGDRCLICLSDYEEDEEVRQLNSCQHIFHRDCIDEWLTTGRNSCPMCRGQGVQELSPTAATSASPQTNEQLA